MQASRMVACSRARVSGRQRPPRGWPAPWLPPGGGGRHGGPGRRRGWSSAAGAGVVGRRLGPWPWPGVWPWLSPGAWPWRSPEAWPSPGAWRGRRRWPGCLSLRAWSWVWRVSHTVVSWSRAAQSMCPVTTGVSIASQAAASAAAPVRYTDPGPAAARAGVQDRSSTEPPRRSVRSTCTIRCGGLAVPARDQLPRYQPPAGFLDRVVAALGRGAGIFRPGLLPQRVQHHREGGGAGGGQVPLQPPGAAERGLQPQRAFLEPVLAACPGRCGRVRAFPGPAAPGHADPRRPKRPRAGSRPRRPGTLPAADRSRRRSAGPARPGPARRPARRRSPGGRPSRRAHPVAAPAAPLVTRVMARSQAAAPYWPSASYPCWAVNAERIAARAAVCWASAASSPVSAAACAAVPSDPASQLAR